MTFGEKLTKLRKEANYTQEQLADILGVSRQSISKWELDVAYPETEKLIKMGKLFDCSVDYLLNENMTQRHAQTSAQFFYDKCKACLRERKSKKMLFGMPLYHIAKDARGFFAVGLKARGVISVGLLSRGIVALGPLAIGVLSLGILSLGVVALGTVALGLLALGAVALGLIAVGAVAFGIVAFGGVAIGLFASGGFSVGNYIAIGDRARASIAVGKTSAIGSEYRFLGLFFMSDVEFISSWLSENVPVWLCWAKDIFLFFVL